LRRSSRSKRWAGSKSGQVAPSTPTAR
jgi:hypothetical protein